MFEGIVSSLLTKYLGEYIKDLDTKSLNIGIWKGSITLRNLEIKPSALDSFDLPITVMNGYLGNMQISIPWTSLKSSPVTVVISDLFLVVCPNKSIKISKERQEEKAYKVKKRLLENHIQMKIQKEIEEREKSKEKNTVEEKEDESNSSFVTKLSETIINNLQIKIEDIHVRYEDFSNEKYPTIFGASLKNLSAESYDQSWNKSFVKDFQSIIYKGIDLESFVIYSDSKENNIRLSNVDSTEKVVSLMKQLINENESSLAMVKPIKGNAKLTIQKTGKLDFKQPRIKADLSFDKAEFLFNDSQYRNLLNLVEYMTNYHKFDEFKSNRPIVSISNAPESQVEWWSYCLNSIKKTVDKDYFTWENFEKKSEQNERYRYLFKKSKNLSWVNEKITNDEKKELEDLEKKLDIEDLILNNGVIDVEIKEETKRYKEYRNKNPKKKSWFGWGDSKDENIEAEIVLGEKEKKELYKAIGYEENQVQQESKLPDDFVEIEFKFFLNKFTFELVDSENLRPFIDFSLNKLNFDFQKNQTSMLIGTNIHSFEICDLLSKETLFRQILFKKNLVNLKQSETLFDLKIEVNPVSKKSDLKVDLSLKELIFVVNIPLIQKILSFFIVPSDLNISTVRDIAREQLFAFRRQAQAQLNQALKDKKVLDLNLSVFSPNVVLPHNCIKKDASALIFNLGRLLIQSNPDKISRNKRIKNNSIQEKDYYDKYNVKVENIGANLSTIQRIIHNIQHKNNVNEDSSSLISKINFETVLDQNVTPATKDKPGFIVNGNLGIVQVNLSYSNVQTILSISNEMMTLKDLPYGTLGIKDTRMYLVKGLPGHRKEWLRVEASVNPNQIIMKEDVTSIKPSYIIDVSGAIKYLPVLESIDPEIESRVQYSLSENKESCFILSLLTTKNEIDHIYFVPEKIENALSFKDTVKGIVIAHREYENTLVAEGQFEGIKYSEKDEETVEDEASAVIADIKLEIEKIGLNFERVLDFSVEDIELKGKIRPFDNCFDFSLGNVEIRNLLSEKSSSISPYIISSKKESKKLLEVVFKQMNEGSPMKTEKSYPMDIDIKVSFISVLVEQNIISRIIKKGYKVADIFADFAKKNINHVYAAPFENEIKYLKEKDTSLDVETKKAEEEEEKDKKTMSLSFEFSKFHGSLIKEMKQFIEMNFEGFALDLDMRTRGMTIKGSMSSAIVENNLLQGDYSKFLTIERDNSSVLNFQYKQENQTSKETEIKQTQFFDLNMNSVKAVILMDQIKLLQDYFVEGEIVKALTDLAKGDNSTTPNNDENTLIEEKITQTEEKKANLGIYSPLQINIHLKSPKIFLPESQYSKNYIIVNLGDITVKNSIENTDQKVYFESYKIESKRTNIQGEVNGSNVSILKDGDINIGFKTLISLDYEKEYSKLALSIMADHVSFELDQEKVDFVFNVLEHNINKYLENNKENTTKENVITNSENKKTETEKPNPERKDMKIDISINKLSIRYTSFAFFLADKLNVGVTLRPFDTLVNVSLVNFNLLDITDEKNQYQFCRALSTEKNVVQVNVSITQEESPIYIKEAATKVDIYLSKFIFVIEPKPLRSMFKMLINTLNRYLKYSGTLPIQNSKQLDLTKEQVDIRSTSVIVGIKLDQIDVSFNENYKKMFHTVIKDLSMNLLTNEKELYFKMSLDNIKIFYLNEGKEEKLIEMVENVRERKFVLDYSQSNELLAKNLEKPEHVRSVKIQIGNISGKVFLPVINYIVYYFTTGPFMDAINEFTNTPETNPTNFSENVEANVNQPIPPNFQLTKLDIELSNPLIILPADFKTEDHLIVNPATIRVYNDIKDLSTGGKNTFAETYFVETQQMYLNSFENRKMYTMIKETSFNVQVQLKVLDESAIIPNLYVRVESDKFLFDLTKHQYDLIMNIIDKNFTGKPLAELPPPQTPQINQSNKNINIIDQQIVVQFKQFETNLYRKDRIIESDAIANVQFTNIDVAYESTIEGKMGVNVTIKAINAFDETIESRNKSYLPYKKFIDSSGIIEHDKNLLSFKYLGDSKNNISMDIDAVAPSLILSPPVVLTLSDFFMQQNIQNKEEQKTQSIFKDVLVSSDFELEQDINLSEKRRIIVEKPEKNKIVIDGRGKTISFEKILETSEIVKDSYYIVIPDSVELVLENANIVYYSVDGSLDQFIQFGRNSKFRLGEKVSKRNLKEEENSEMIIGANISNMKVVIPDIESKYSKAIMLKFGVSGGYNKKPTTEVGFVKINELNCVLENDSVLSTLVEPICFFANFKAVTTQNLVSREVKVHVDSNFSTRISFQNIRSIQRIVESFTKPDSSKSKEKMIEYAVSHEENHDDVTTDEQDDKDKFEDATDQDELNLLIPRRTEDDIGAKSPMKIEQNSIVIPEIEQQNIVIFDTQEYIFNLLIVDDSRGFDVPLIDLNIVNAKVKAAITQKAFLNINTVAFLTLTSNFYNVNYAEWEPFLEPYSFVLSYVRTPTFYENYPYTDTIVLNSKKETLSENEIGAEFPENNVLNLNISKEMINTIYETSKMWNQELQTFEASVKVKAPYVIKNDIGVPIKVYIHQTKETFVVGNMTSKDIFINEFQSSSIGSNVWNKNVFADIEAEGFKKITVDLRKVNKVKFFPNMFIEPNALNYFKYCIVDVSMKELQKIIYIRSIIKINNKSTISWEIGVSNASNQIQSLGILLSRQSKGFPHYQFFNKNKLHFRPVTGHGSFSWNSTNQAINIEEQFGSNKSLYEINNEYAGGISYNCIVAKKIQKDEFLENIVFNIYPVLKIENLLAVKMTCTLYEVLSHKSDRIDEVYSIQLKSGEIDYVYRMDMTKSYIARIQLHDSNNWRVKKDILISNGKTKELENEKDEIILIDSRDRELRVNMIQTQGLSKNSFRKLSFFCPYWIINKMDHELHIYDSGNEIAGSKQLSSRSKTPLMFDFINKDKNTKLVLRVNNSEKSKKFSIENIGLSGNFSLQEGDQRRYDIGISINKAPGKFSRTKIVSFTPQFIIVNNTKAYMHVKESKAKKGKKLDVGEKLSWDWESVDASENISFNINPEIYQWSHSFKVTALGDIFIKLIPKIKGCDIFIFNVKIQNSGSSVFVIVQEIVNPPYVIDNRLSIPVTINQSDCQEKWLVRPHEQIKYAWDSPNKKQKINIFINDKEVKNFNINQVNAVEVLKSSHSKHGDNVHIYTEANGPTRVLILDTKLKNEMEDSVEVDTIVFAGILDEIGLSLINNRKQEVAYLRLHKFEMKYKTTDKKQYYEAKIFDVQFDCQIHDCTYPVIFYDQNLENNFLHLSICQNTREESINMFPYFSIATQEMVLQIDYAFISYLTELIEAFTVSNDEDDVKSLNEFLSSLENPIVVPESEKKFYFDRLELNPIRIILSFKYTKPKNVKQASHNPVLMFIDSAGFTFASIDRAALNFNALLLENLFLNQEELIDRIKHHYIRQGATELYKLIGALDFIGNPIGLVSDLSSGVKDFFFEPASAIVHNPETFGKSVGKGTKSLISNTVHGTFGATSKVAGSVQKGLKAFTFDKEYIDSSQSFKRNPRGMREGVEMGAEELAKGFYEGATGLFRKPHEGLQKGGVVGFAKGTGKAFLGVGVKPIVGFVSLAQKTTEGISKMGKKERPRKRLPRSFRLDGLIQTYNEAEAYGLHLMNNIEDSKFENDSFISIFANEKNSLILLTKQNVICLKDDSKKENELPSLEWYIPIVSIAKVYRNDKCTEIGIEYESSHEDGTVRKFLGSAVHKAKILTSPRGLFNSRHRKKDNEDDGGLLKNRYNIFGTKKQEDESKEKTSPRKNIKERLIISSSTEYIEFTYKTLDDLVQRKNDKK